MPFQLLSSDGDVPSVEFMEEDIFYDLDDQNEIN